MHSESSSVGRSASSVDPVWFREFYDEALPVVYGYFFKRCGGRRDVVADLTQETFLSALQSLEKGALVEAQLPWVVAIARRRLVDHIRRKTKRNSGQVEDPVIWVGPGWTSDAEVRLIDALNRLGDDQRLALILRYVDDLEVGEVAELMGKSVRATESLLVRARASLSDSFEAVSMRRRDDE